MFRQTVHAGFELEHPYPFLEHAVHPVPGEHPHRSHIELWVLEPTVRMLFEPEVLLLLV